MPGSLRVSFLVTLLIASCGKTATVHLKGDESVEAWIIRSEGDQVYLLPHGQVEERIVTRSEIYDIDHPGNVHLGIGVSMAVVGAAGIAAGILVGADSEEDSGTYKFAMYGLLPAGGVLALVGGGLGVWGLTVYSKSRDASIYRVTGLVRPRLYPLAFRSGQRVFYGAGLSWYW